MGGVGRDVDGPGRRWGGGKGAIDKQLVWRWGGKAWEGGPDLQLGGGLGGVRDRGCYEPGWRVEGGWGRVLEGPGRG